MAIVHLDEPNKYMPNVPHPACGRFIKNVIPQTTQIKSHVTCRLCKKTKLYLKGLI